MSFTPEEMNQIVNKNGPAWDKLQKEKKGEAKRILEWHLNEILIRAERECKETGSCNFQVISRPLLDENYRELHEEVYKNIFNHLKNVGFKLIKMKIYYVCGSPNEVTFYFGEPENIKTNWKERLYDWLFGISVYYGK